MDWKDLIDDMFQAYALELCRYLMSFRLSEEEVYDLVQTTFLKLIESNPKKPKHPKSWLFTVGRNLAIDLIRRNQKLSYLSSFDGLKDDSPDSLAKMQQDEQLAQAKRAFSQLSPSHQELIRLRIEHEFTYAQIAKILGKTELAVRTAMVRARKEFKKAWNRENRK